MKYVTLHNFLVMQFVLILIFFSFAPALAAEGVRLLADLDYVSTNNEITNKQSGSMTETDFYRTSQLYHVDIGRTLYPNLRFTAGGMYNVDHATTTTADSKFKTKDTTLRPSLGFLLRNQLYTAGVTYQKTQIENIATGVTSQKRFSDLYTAQFNYKPADLPRVTMNYSHFLSHDEPQSYDSVNDRFSLTSKYTYKDFIFDYALTQNDTLQKVANSEVESTTHRGGIRFSRQFFDKRLTLNASSKVNQATTEFSGTGDSELRVNASQTVVPNTTDTDGDPDPTDDTSDTFLPFTTPVDIGKTSTQNMKNSFVLDFGSQVDVDFVYVLFQDNDLQSGNYALLSQIATLPASSFQWQVYTSTDQLTWIQLTAPNVSFPSFMTLDNDNRFRITLSPTVTAQYVKVVATTLSAGSSVEGAIEVKGLEAYTRIPGNSGIKHKSKDQNYDLGFQWRFSERTAAGYEFKLKDQKSEPDGLSKTQTLNGVNFRHSFNPIFLASTRILRTDTDETVRDGNTKKTNYDYSATLKGNYLDTFSQTLAYSGTSIEEPDGSSGTNSLLLRNNAILYSGWSLNLDLIHSWTNPLEGNKSTTESVRTETNIIPNNKVTLSFDYTVSWTDEEDGTPTDRQNGNIQLFLLPWRTLSVTAAHSFQVRKAAETDTFDTQNYSISWNPFLDGTLQLGLSYDETRNSDDNKTTSITPRLTWKITRNSVLTLSYVKSTNESETVTTDGENYNGNIRIFF